MIQRLPYGRCDAVEPETLTTLNVERDHFAIDGREKRPVGATVERFDLVGHGFEDTSCGGIAK